MKDEVFKVDFLGELKIEEVFYFYEEPLLFSCFNEYGQKFLIILTDSDKRQWFIIPIAPLRLNLLKAKKINVRSVITNCSNNLVWEVEEIGNNNYKLSKQVSVSDITDIDLPDDDLYLA